MDRTLIEALLNPAVYPHPVERVTLLETHISWVLLAGDYVYKIKKPLNLGFLDFSTLARRAYFCREEVRLNRRSAPALYLAVVPIGGSLQRPCLNGSGEPIEYAVCMRRFAAGDGFDRLLAEGRLRRRHVLELAEQLAQLHRDAEVAASDTEFGRPDRVLAPMRDNLTTLREILNEAGTRYRLEHLAEWTEARFAVLQPLLAQRCREGFVRECHGDAHLGNVTLFQERVTLFDCIEFSEELRWIDVMSDLAFTVMDLRYRGAEASSWLLLDRYLSRSGDFQGLGVLTFYLVYRALVRAKVTALRLDDARREPQRHQALNSEIADYLTLAERMAADHRPALLITMGLSGSGKTHLGDRLLQSLGVIRLRSDVERKRLHGLAPEASSHSGLSAGIYGAAASHATYARLLEQADSVIRCGLPVLVDATFLERQRRDAFRRLAQERGVPFRLLACEADEAVLRSRILRRRDRNEDASEADLAVLDRQLARREPLTPEEQQGVLRIDTGSDAAVDAVLDKLAHEPVFRRR